MRTAPPRSSRVSAAFRLVIKRASKRLPWISRTKLRFCANADADHKRKWRQFMHSNERPMTVCAARAAEVEMTDSELVGMIAHELGHVAGEALGFPEHAKHTKAGKTPQAVQDEADWIARHVIGFKVRYNRRTLQEAV